MKAFFFLLFVSTAFAAGYPAPLLVQEWLPGALQGMSGVFWDGRLRAVLHQTYPRTWPRLTTIVNSCRSVMRLMSLYVVP